MRKRNAEADSKLPCMTRESALQFVQRVRALSLRNSGFCEALSRQLSDSEQGCLRLWLLEAGECLGRNQALAPRYRKKEK